MVYMVAVCGSYLFAYVKTSNMQLSQNNVTTSHLIRHLLKQERSDLLSAMLIYFHFLLYLTS